MAAALSFEQREHRRAFGARVSSLRRERDMTQEKLSEASGLHRSYVASVEGGGRNPTLDVIVKLAQALQVPPRDLLG